MRVCIIFAVSLVNSLHLSDVEGRCDWTQSVEDDICSRLNICDELRKLLGMFKLFINILGPFKRLDSDKSDVIEGKGIKLDLKDICSNLFLW